MSFFVGLLAFIGVVALLVVVFGLGFAAGMKVCEDTNHGRPPDSNQRSHPGSSPGRRRPNQDPLHRILSDEEFQKFMQAAPKWVIHEDRDSWDMPRLLVRVPMRGEEDIVAVLVHDATLGKGVYIRVPPQARTCHEAVAWSFHMRPSEYRVERET